MNNLPPFYVGQKVVYITGISMPKNSVHTVKNFFRRPCGCWRINISSDKLERIPRSDFKPDTTHVRCKNCLKVEPIEKWLNTEKGWDATSFRPLQEKGFPLIQLTKVIEKEQQLVSAN